MVMDLVIQAKLTAVVFMATFMQRMKSITPVEHSLPTGVCEDR